MAMLYEQRNHYYEDTLSAKFALMYFLGSIAWRLLKVVATRVKPGYSYDKQRLTYPAFEVTMCRFHSAILVAFARIIMGSQYAIVLAKGGIARRLLRPFSV